MANRRKGKHIITTKVEHASVYEPMYHLEEEGYEVTYLDVDSEGIVDLDQLEESIREDTILVSTMYVNNEIGTLEPIEEIGKIIKRKKIQRHSGMWMQSRPMESTVFIRKNLALICSRSADISCMTKRSRIPLCSKRSEDPSADPGRRPAERDAFRDR